MSIAKAVAAFLTPIVLALLVKALDAAGVDVAIDPGLVETLLTAVVTGVAVWATRNRPSS